jgi:hypothetical protein
LLREHKQKDIAPLRINADGLFKKEFVDSAVAFVGNWLK